MHFFNVINLRKVTIATKQFSGRGFIFIEECANSWEEAVRIKRMWLSSSLLCCVALSFCWLRSELDILLLHSFQVLSLKLGQTEAEFLSKVWLGTNKGLIIFALRLSNYFLVFLSEKYWIKYSSIHSCTAASHLGLNYFIPSNSFSVVATGLAFFFFPWLSGGRGRTVVVLEGIGDGMGRKEAQSGAGFNNQEARGSVQVFVAWPTPASCVPTQCLSFSIWK